MSDSRSLFSPLRLIAFVFLILAGVLLAMDVIAAVQIGAWAPKPLGRLWYEIDPSSLNGLQAGIERYVWPPLWDPGIVTLLLWPAWVLPGAIGLFVLVLKQLFFR